MDHLLSMEKEKNEKAIEFCLVLREYNLS